MKNIAVNLYTQADWPSFREYIKRWFQEKYILGDPRYLAWQFGDHFYIAKAGEEVIGHFGFRDLVYKVRDRSLSIRVLMNLFVLKPYRVAGIAALLTKKVFDTRNPLLVFRYRPVAEKLFLHLRPNWRNFGNFKRYLAILDAQAPLLSKYKIPDASVKEFKGKDFDINEISSFTSDFNDLWNRIKARYLITIERTPEYLAWRYREQPFFNYKILTAKKDGLLQGYLVWRLEEDQGFRIARIVDLASTIEAEAVLIREFLAYARRENASAADFLLSLKLRERTLASTGFFDVSGTDFENFPTLFSPISYERPFINIGCDFDMPPESGYFTKADGDQDRPNPH